MDNNNKNNRFDADRMGQPRDTVNARPIRTAVRTPKQINKSSISQSYNSMPPNSENRQIPPRKVNNDNHIPSPPVDFYPLAGRNSYIASHKEESLIPYLILCAMALISIIFAFSAYGGYIFASATGGFKNDPAATDVMSAVIAGVMPIDEPDDAVTPPESDTSGTNTPDTAPPSNGTDGTDTPDVPERYDYTRPVPESDTASDSYIKSSVFIGDSRTEGLWLYSKMKATFICERGLNVSTARESKLDKYDGQTAIQVLSSVDCDNIYISFGVNEVGWPTSSFIKAYGQLIDEIRAMKPNAKIYVQNIFPMSKESHDAAIYGNNDDIWRHNEAISEMCAEKEVYLLDVAAYFTDNNGNLKDSYDTGVDGAHFKAGGQGYVDWTNYIKTHIIK